MQTSIKGHWKFLSDNDRLEYGKYERQYTSSVHLLYRYLCRETKGGIETLKEKSAYYYKNSLML